jgi:hypothetical protein
MARGGAMYAVYHRVISVFLNAGPFAHSRTGIF